VYGIAVGDNNAEGKKMSMKKAPWNSGAHYPSRLSMPACRSASFNYLRFLEEKNQRFDDIHLINIDIFSLLQISGVRPNSGISGKER